ncbi:MAG TPA: KamA family radical SAM protein [Caldisericia bacterium]|nr:KamA family radical SAM protein [Caldisericia bacterium]HPF48256.1 KamA family radical SAM protein [Caldisericia bacterium]HPI83808.1 KamA family radical SAM protein [Caldisericia bacterium]HPQ92709.1 KamA family radical SAM protein [Caldisericia bacterium]HRV74193.1 KamA family radical SAM protein [Caldisericia bacterium]
MTSGTLAYPRYITKLDDVVQLDPDERQKLKEVTKKFAFRANDYYLSLINWDDPGDPIRNIIIPRYSELEDSNVLDPSDESKYTILPGLQHKYPPTALLLTNDFCGGFCRYCFRKRLFMNIGSEEVARSIDKRIDYIREHTEITNVLLTGGDPLLLPTKKLQPIIDAVAAIPHVRIIRIGSKMPAFNPYRIIRDKQLPQLISDTSTSSKKVYIMTHFTHTNEITDVAKEAIEILQHSGAIMCNQTPILRGINDKVSVLSGLLKELTFIGIAPYYIFQCRPTAGNKTYSVPLEEAFKVFNDSKEKVSGLAKRVKFVLSTKRGKLQVVGFQNGKIVFSHHEPVDLSKHGTLEPFDCDPEKYWYDEYLDESIS